MTVKTVTYISGPMRGYPNYNHDTFCAVQKELESRGDTVLNPALNFNGEKDHPVADYMRTDIAQVLKAHRIVLLPGWDRSEGARLEVAVGRALALPFFEALMVENVWGFATMAAPSGNAESKSPRADALDEAKALITGDRNNAYGPPTADFQRTAAMASAFGFQVNGVPLDSHHVAIFMILLKMSRLSWTPTKRDSWVDTAGYAGCGFECAITEAA